MIDAGVSARACAPWDTTPGAHTAEIPAFSQDAPAVSTDSAPTVGVITREYGAGRTGPGYADELRLRSHLGELALC